MDDLDFGDLEPASAPADLSEDDFEIIPLDELEEPDDLEPSEEDLLGFDDKFDDKGLLEDLSDFDDFGLDFGRNRHND